MATIIKRLCRRNSINVFNYLNSKTIKSSRYVCSLYCGGRCIAPSTNMFIRNYSKECKKLPQTETPEKKSLVKRFKEMYRDYWYVLIPVHVITSVAWFGGFYYVARSGVDIVALMEHWHISDVIINPLRGSSMGYIAVSYALYKIFTPLRYTVTLGGTTISINYLKKWGYIKPVPSAEQLKNLYYEKKDTVLESMKEKKEDLKAHKEQLIEKHDQIMHGLEKKIKSKITDSKERLKEKITDSIKVKHKNK